MCCPSGRTAHLGAAQFNILNEITFMQGVSLIHLEMRDLTGYVSF